MILQIRFEMGNHLIIFIFIWVSCRSTDCQFSCHHQTQYISFKLFQTQNWCHALSADPPPSVLSSDTTIIYTSSFLFFLSNYDISDKSVRTQVAKTFSLRLPGARRTAVLPAFVSPEILQQTQLGKRVPAKTAEFRSEPQTRVQIIIFLVYEGPLGLLWDSLYPDVLKKWEGVEGDGPKRGSWSLPPFPVIKLLLPRKYGKATWMSAITTINRATITN